MADAIAGDNVAVSAAVAASCAHDSQHFEADGRTCHRMFEAAVRKMERMRGPHWIDYRA
jgi:hypothetical protein